MRAARSSLSVLFLAIVSGVPVWGGQPDFTPPEALVELDRQLDWAPARHIAVQDRNRYKSLESYAREVMSHMTGSEHLPGLSPLASLLEWHFNAGAYADAPVVRIKDRGMRIHLSAHLPEPQRNRIQSTGFVTLNELKDPVVTQRMRELEGRFEMVSSMRRVREAETVAKFLDRLTRIVPLPGRDAKSMWATPKELTPNLPAELLAAAGYTRQTAQREFGQPIPGVTPAVAQSVIVPWSSLMASWAKRDAAGVQNSLERLEQVLPALAEPGVYPRQSQLAAEARYYAFGKFTWGYWVYLLGALVGIWALVTHWKTPWVISLGLLTIAMGLHAYGLGLRWYILDRIPVANMFEAVVASAWMGVALGLVVELVFRTRVFLIGAHATGFFALVLGQYVIPGHGSLESILGILDDVMLRIHTVLIIASYSLIFLASVIAVIYLFGYYFIKDAIQSLQAGLVTAFTGAALWLVGSYLAFHAMDGGAAVVKQPGVAPTFWIAAALAGLVIAFLVWKRAYALLPSVALMGTASATLAIGTQGFVLGMAWSLLSVGLVWAIANGIGLGFFRGRVAGAESTAATGQPVPALAGAGGPLVHGREAFARLQRPIMAGGAPGDESKGSKLPVWLHHFDWSHLIILNLVFVLLFVGIILGAIWADYSWGRPWGWDPKEVFAMNTWIIYAILIHTRFVVKNKGLWTAWMSVAGCLMMAFNWCFVNFFIVGIHSYA